MFVFIITNQGLNTDFIVCQMLHKTPKHKTIHTINLGGHAVSNATKTCLLCICQNVNFVFNFEVVVDTLADLAHL